jgi:Zn-dependent peptidase ImmA (M78 family)
MPSFERGFKSWAERTASNIRHEMGLSQFDRLDPFQLASLLEITVCTPRDIPGLPADVLDQLLAKDPWGWSAVSFVQPDGNTIVIYNSRKSAGRKSSDIGHELSHVIQQHKPGMIMLSHDGSLAMRTYNQKQEDEANWLAWCMLLPREALVKATREGLTTKEIAELYGVTERLVTFRMSVTGVGLQMRRNK